MPFKSRHSEGNRKDQIERFIQSFPMEMRYTVVHSILMECIKKISRTIIDTALSNVREQYKLPPLASFIPKGQLRQINGVVFKCIEPNGDRGLWENTETQEQQVFKNSDLFMNSQVINSFLLVDEIEVPK